LIFHSIFADFTGINTFNLWNARLKSDSEGSKSQKFIQFYWFLKFTWLCPGKKKWERL